MVKTLEGCSSKGLLLPRNRSCLKFLKLRCGHWRIKVRRQWRGSMKISADLVQDAETQLLELVRGKNTNVFAVTIVSGNDKWIISTTDSESGAYCIGEGLTFADAWHARENQLYARVKASAKRPSSTGKAVQPRTFGYCKFFRTAPAGYN